MILAIDVGGTKTLVAVANKNGKLLFEEKFPTPQSYKQFIKELSIIVDKITTPYNLAVVAAPGKIDRKNGIGLVFGNLPWKNVTIQKDISVVTKTKVLIENDANLAGLSEAIRIKPLPSRALYLTFSTGIGSGVISNGKIDEEFADSEAGSMLFEYEGKLLPWEKFDSGKAIVEKYGQRASELNDPRAWQKISKWFAIGIIDLCAVLEPDVVIIGGGVGAHFHKYSKFLTHHVHKMAPKLVTVPPIVAAQKAEEAVIYGCIELARQYSR